MKNHTTVYPGTAQHQALLQQIVAHYQNDPRVRAVIVFGSLGRGNWDAYSDIDLDVVSADEARVDVLAELEQLCAGFAGLSEKLALIVPDGDDAGDVVLESLLMLSVRYHPLAQTKPAIVESMQVLSGSLERAVILAAAEANRPATDPPLSQLLDECLRYAAVANVGLQREQVWYTVEVLHRLRGLLMEIFARTRDGTRGYRTFEAEAGEWLQQRLGATLPTYDLGSVRAALEAALDFLETDLGELADGQLELGEGQRVVLRGVREAFGATGNAGTRRG